MWTATARELTTRMMNNPQMTQLLELLHSISVSPAAVPYEVLKTSRGRLWFETTERRQTSYER
jgi:hypothetical protein